MLIVPGSSHPELAKTLAKTLQAELASVERTIFPNGEQRVHIETPLKGKAVLILQSFSTPPDSTLLEFLLLLDAAKREHPKKIIGVIPWLGYSPQDKVFRSGESLSSQLIARLLKIAGLNQAVCLDLHSPNNLTHLKEAGIQVLEASALAIFTQELQQYKNNPEWAVLCVDKGALNRSQEFARALNLPLIKLKKNRDLKNGTVTFEDFTENIQGKKLISFDDFVSTGSTRIQAAKTMKELGAKEYIDCITHGLLGADSPQRIEKSKIDKVYLTDSYPIPKTKKVPKIKVLSCAPVLKEAIQKLAL